METWNRPEPPKLEFKRGLGAAHVVDTRQGGFEVSQLDGDYLTLALTLDKQPATRGELKDRTSLPADRVDEICAEFEREQLILEVDGRLLWLPITNKGRRDVRAQRCVNEVA